MIQQNWVLRNFQCACLLGMWTDVLNYGRQLETIKPDDLSNNSNNVPSQQSSAPLHPLHLFEYIALKLPNQSANFTQVYYHVEKYVKQFDPLLTPPLKFTEWSIRDCLTCLKYGFTINHLKNQMMQEQIDLNKNNGLQRMPQISKFMFIYGCLVQFPYFWVQLPANNNKTMQPVVLTGPWNDSEMELTASYIRRIPNKEKVEKSDNDNNNNNNNNEIIEDEKENDKNNNDKIRVVRSDLILHLERHTPTFSKNLDDFIGLKSDHNDNKNGIKHNNNNNSNNNNNANKISGWKWIGTFDHTEGTLEINEDKLNDFTFRRNSNWQTDAIDLSVRTWDIYMIISSPD